MRNPITRTNKQKKPRILKTCSLNFFSFNNQDPLLAGDQRCFQLLGHLCPPNVLTSWRSCKRRKHVDQSLLTFPWQQYFRILARQIQRHLVQTVWTIFLFWGLYGQCPLGMHPTRRPITLTNEEQKPQNLKTCWFESSLVSIMALLAILSTPIFGRKEPLVRSHNQ